MRACGVLLLLSAIGVLGLVALAGSGHVQIQAIQPLGEDEVVTIVNRGSQPVELGGWRLESSNSLGQEVKETFWFPRDCPLPPGGVVRVHSGPAARRWAGSTCAEGELGWLAVEVWNDKADVAWLRDAAGELVDLYTYTVGEPPTRPTPILRPGAKAETETAAGAGAGAGTMAPKGSSPLELELSGCVPSCSCCYCCYCRPACPAIAGCCTVRVILEGIELVFNRGVGENWHFFASAGPVEPEVSTLALPQVLYEGLFRGEGFVQLGAGAVEVDRSPDRGWVQQELRLCCPLSPLERTVTLEVYVREDEDCCSGCVALWRFTFEVSVEPVTWRARGAPPPPRAEFTIVPSGERRLGEIVALDASPSQGEGLSYAWDFDGDGRADATGAQVTYRLIREGLNLITLIVTDRLGRSASQTRGIQVLPALAAKPKAGAGKEGLDLGLFWLTLPALAVGYFLVLAFRG
jgi:hypothetical protein